MSERLDNKTNSAVATAAEIREKGSAVVRGVWPPDVLAKLREAISTFSARRRQRLMSGDVLPTEKMFATHGAGTFINLLRDGVATPQILRDLFVGSYYHEVCAEYFQDDQFYVLLNRIGFRDHDPLSSDRSFIPYHQDSYTQDHRVAHVLNCWITLDPGAGRDAPGLEVVRDPCIPNFPRKTFGLKSENAAYDNITIEREKIVEAYGESFLAPEFDVGDGLIFSENVIHRTYVTPNMTKPRINFELRVFTPKALTPGAKIADFAANAFRLA